MNRPITLESERCTATVRLEDSAADSLMYVRVTVTCELKAGHDGDHQGRAQDGPVGAPQEHPVRWPREDDENP